MKVGLLTSTDKKRIVLFKGQHAQPFPFSHFSLFT